MTKKEFQENIIHQLEQRGYRHISVSLSLFGLKADVTARDRDRKKHYFKVETYRKGRRTLCRFKDTSDLSWIDGLEFFDAIFDDK